jgi:hypothetical protein
MTARARSVVGGLVVALVMAWSGQAAAQNIYRDYYTPQFYMDHLVFYDEAAQPIYYVGDVAYSVPSDTPFYEELVIHYEQNADAYHRWFEEVGYAHLSYRRPVAAHGYTPMYYLDYPVFFDDAGRPVYYVDGVAHPIPPAYPRYHLYVSHWRARRALYLRWYNSHGRHYRWWRRPIATGYYSPLYYDGYVVFYDDSGAPYYYMGGRTVYIPRTHRDYNRYHSHWRTHRGNYRRWYKSAGHRQHAYRQPRAYRRRAVVTTAPRAVRGRAVQRTYRRRPVVRPRPGRPGPHARPGQPGRPPHARPGHPGRPGPQARPGRPGPQARPGHPGRPGPQARPGRPGPQARPGPGRPVHPRERPGVHGGPGRPGPQARPGRPGPQARPGHPGRPPHAGQPGRPPHAGQPGRPPHARPGQPGAKGRPTPPGRPGPGGGRIDCRTNPGHPACAGRAGPHKPNPGGRQAGPAPGRRGPAGPPPGGHKQGPRPGPRGRHR